MAALVFKPNNFQISDTAKEEILHLRALFEKEINEKSDVIMIGWGEYNLSDGKRFGNVVVSFYTVSQRNDIKSHIVVVDGMEIVFFTIPKYYEEFEGKTLTFSSECFQLASID